MGHYVLSILENSVYLKNPQLNFDVFIIEYFINSFLLKWHPQLYPISSTLFPKSYICCHVYHG